MGKVVVEVKRFTKFDELNEYLRTTEDRVKNVTPVVENVYVGYRGGGENASYYERTTVFYINIKSSKRGREISPEGGADEPG